MDFCINTTIQRSMEQASKFCYIGANLLCHLYDHFMPYTSCLNSDGIKRHKCWLTRYNRTLSILFCAALWAVAPGLTAVLCRCKQHDGQRPTLAATPQTSRTQFAYDCARLRLPSAMTSYNRSQCGRKNVDSPRHSGRRGSNVAQRRF